MEKGATPKVVGGFLLIVALALLLGNQVLDVSDAAVAEIQPRADVLAIDAMGVFGPLERPPVTFLHSRHSEVLAKAGKDCQTCHLKEKDRLSMRYMRLSDGSRQEVMDAYHTNCIHCHQSMAAGGQASGPTTCNVCHDSNSMVRSVRQPFGMDLSLHYRHIKSQGQKCETCHHQYDQEQGKLVYVKGQEGSCRYCHKEVTEGKALSLREAFHQACISCHQQAVAQHKTAGPVDCLGCHEAGAQAEIARLDEFPRLERNQPDVVLVKATIKTTAFGNPGTMATKRVPFNHKAHEQYNGNCRTCHHADLTACVNCHTVEGSPAGNFVRIEQAMHQISSDKSCVGCHAEKQADPKCAGCHDLMPYQPSAEPAACKQCHVEVGQGARDSMDPEQAAQLAQYYLDSRQPVKTTYFDSDLPEKVTINGIQKEYGAVILPHARIVKSLMDQLAGNQLAAHFHSDPGTLCQGCHHNSPPSKKPPLCISCHGAASSTHHPGRPGITGAYHQQCNTCHQAMGITKVDSRDCSACHQSGQDAKPSSS